MINQNAIDPSSILQFSSALQLSIDSILLDLILKDDVYTFKFDRVEKHDHRLKYFQKMVDGEFKKNTLVVHNKNQDWSLIYNFLILSRLRDEFMKKLASDEPRYNFFLDKIGLEQAQDAATTITSIKEASDVIFAKVKQDKITFRELSQKTGLTQVTLNRFKSGHDTKLSSLLKIAQALDLKISIF